MRSWQQRVRNPNELFNAAVAHHSMEAQSSGFEDREVDAEVLTKRLKDIDKAKRLSIGYQRYIVEIPK